MPANPSVEPDDIFDLVNRLKLATTVSELHGSLAGFISGGGRFHTGGVLEALHLEAGTTASEDDLKLLSRFRDETEKDLDDSDLVFQPWLPDDDSSLTERAEALVEWTRGFLGGLGLGGAARAKGKLSKEAQEVLKDMATIASTEFDFAEDSEEDEDSLIEITEFVRVGALLLHAELSNVERPASDTLH
ncbi:hypothetical protein EC912_10894 [Luteibacter rhizovicinus]|uniref:YecA family protein n=1 Tax=Luteibacter rhizovicinus TaxID=242606 RepID=A0A4R3YIT3_9GAMM|nr:UPF0149 family protein [Luteibacter rhizovicinus]TCV92100.1 hypothetical protein EC912_10894 [Luteibacter rhizovicinus]